MSKSVLPFLLALHWCPRPIFLYVLPRDTGAEPSAALGARHSALCEWAAAYPRKGELQILTSTEVRTRAQSSRDASLPARPFSRPRPCALHGTACIVPSTAWRAQQGHGMLGTACAMRRAAPPHRAPCTPGARRRRCRCARRLAGQRRAPRPAADARAPEQGRGRGRRGLRVRVGRRGRGQHLLRQVRRARRGLGGASRRAAPPSSSATRTLTQPCTLTRTLYRSLHLHSPAHPPHLHPHPYPLTSTLARCGWSRWCSSSRAARRPCSSSRRRRRAPARPKRATAEAARLTAHPHPPHPTPPLLPLLTPPHFLAPPARPRPPGQPLVRRAAVLRRRVLARTVRHITPQVPLAAHLLAQYKARRDGGAPLHRHLLRPVAPPAGRAPETSPSATRKHERTCTLFAC